MRSGLIIIILSSILLVSGCVSQTNIPQDQNNATGPALKEFTLTISHTSYSPSVLTVNKGDMIRVNAVSVRGTGLESGFSHNHGVAIDEYNIDVSTPSETTPTVINFVADKSGTFTIYCKSCWDGPFGKEHPDIRAMLVVNP